MQTDKEEPVVERRHRDPEIQRLTAQIIGATGEIHVLVKEIDKTVVSLVEYIATYPIDLEEADKR